MKKISKYGINATLLLVLATNPVKTAEHLPQPSSAEIMTREYTNLAQFYTIQPTDTAYPQKNDLEERITLLDEYLAYENKLSFHLNTIEEFAKFYGQFDTTYSNTNTLLKTGLAQANIESRFQQTTRNNNILRSWADAKGVFQFQEIALIEANKILKRLQEQDSSYYAVDSIDVALAQEPTPEGAKESIRAGMFMLKFGLEHHKGDWEWHMTRYNWGTGNLQDAGITHRNFRENKENLPEETQKYLSRAKYLMNTKGADVDAYKEELLNYELQKLYRRQLSIASSSKHTLERREDAIKELREFTSGLHFINGDPTEAIKPYIAKMHYYAGDILLKQNKPQLAKQQYLLAQNIAEEDSLVYRNTEYRLKIIANQT